MGSKWKSIVLNDLINQGHAFLQTGPFGTALKAEEYSDNGVPLISVREIRNGYIKIESTTPRVSRHTTSRLPKFVLNKGDIVFARGNDSNLLIVFYVQIMPDDLVMQLHRF